MSHCGTSHHTHARTPHTPSRACTVCGRQLALPGRRFRNKLVSGTRHVVAPPLQSLALAALHAPAATVSATAAVGAAKWPGLVFSHATVIMVLLYALLVFWPQSHLVRKFSAAVLVCVYVAQSSGMWSRPPFNAPYMQAIWPQYGVTSTLTAPCALGPALLVSADTPRHSLPHATVWAGSSLLRVCCRSRCLGMPAAHADPHLAPPSYHAIGCRRAGLNICFPNANGDCLGPPPYAGLLPSQVCKGQRRHLVTGDLLVVFAHRCYCHSNACAGLLQGADTVAW
jgi:hypothetical protein